MPQSPDIITYEQVKNAMTNPPPRELVDLFNDLSISINQHPLCISEKKPFNKLCKPGSFCVSATSIQSGYIAFVLGKHVQSKFPEEIISQFFNLDFQFKLQFGIIKGEQIDGCICLVHICKEHFNLNEVYNHIYS